MCFINLLVQPVDQYAAVRIPKGNTGLDWVRLWKKTYCSSCFLVSISILLSKNESKDDYVTNKYLVSEQMMRFCFCYDDVFQTLTCKVVFLVQLL